MQIYEIEFVFENKQLEDDLLEDEMQDDIDELQDTIGRATIYLGATDIADVMIQSMDVIKTILEDKPYDIITIRAMPGVDVLNWVGEFDPCDCPYCKAERMADEDLMHFDCPSCNSKIKVADGDWLAINCIECGYEINRDRIIDIGRGNYKVLELKG